MEITEVRIKLMDDPQERLQAFCSITFDGCFVVRDLKIIQGSKGSFVAMPSRKLTDRCPRCSFKNHLRASHCNQCGVRLDEDRAAKNMDGRAKLYADIAHPINSSCREMIQAKVLESFEVEMVRSRQPGYQCSYDDYGEDQIATLRIDEYHSQEETVPEPTSPVLYTGSDERIHRIDPAEEKAESPRSSNNNPHSRPDPIRITTDNEPSGHASDEEAFGVGLD